jgi:tripartite-type tricarboxylate transporter receptor subunit TctC
VNVSDLFSGLKAIGLAIAILTAVAASADEFPNRPIRFVLPTVPGGGTDAQARFVAKQVEKQTGWTIIVENRPGADGSIAADFVAKSKPDAHTLLVTTSGHLLLPFTKKNLPYDTLGDFVGVTALTRNYAFVTTSTSLKLNTLGDLLRLMRAAPGKYSYATPESFGYLQTMRFNKNAGVQAIRVPYRGSGALVTDVASGLVTYAIMTVSAAKPMIDTGKMRALCVGSNRRIPEFPLVPTCPEEGVPYDGGNRTEVYAPAGTPAALVNRMQKEIVAALRSQELASSISAQYVEIIGNTPAEMAQDMKTISRRYAELTREVGIVPE